MAGRPRLRGASSAEFTVHVRELRRAGIPAAEIARRTGFSRDFISKVDLGKRSLSEGKAAAALERLGSGEYSERRVLTREYGDTWIAPLTFRDFSKVSRWQNLFGRAKRTADFAIIRRQSRRSDLRIRVAGEGSVPVVVYLESDPARLREAAELLSGEVREGPSPTAGQAAA